MGYLDYLGNDDVGGGLDGANNLDSALLLHEYQKKSITGKKADYNYEYDLFPKKFIYSKNFNGMASNPHASNLDKLHTESFLTNKVRHIENVYLGSNEMPEEYERQILPQAIPYPEYSAPKKCGCSNCKNNVLDEYMRRNDVNIAIEELQKRNEILTLLLIFIVIYCLVQLFYPARSLMTYSLPVVGINTQVGTNAPPEVIASSAPVIVETVVQPAVKTS